MWYYLCKAADCPSGSACERVVGDRIVALFNLEGCYHALDGICPHQGGPLGKGELHGCIVTCPWHGWQFDVTTGQHQASASLRHGRFLTKVDGDDVWIDLGD